MRFLQCLFLVAATALQARALPPVVFLDNSGEQISDERRSFNAHVISVHDGDTITARIDLGFDVAIVTEVRLDGIDAPELNTPEGKVSAAFLQQYLKDQDVVLVVNAKRPREKFGRVLATVWCKKFDVCAIMVAKKLAVPYHGGKRTPPPKAAKIGKGVDWKWKRGITGTADAYGDS